MSAYKEKTLWEKRINELTAKIKEFEFQLTCLRLELSIAEQNLAESERDVKWEAQNDSR